MNAWQYHYHYTDKKGLEGILRDKYLRATFVTQTNDNLEFTHGIKLIHQHLRKKNLKDEYIKRFLDTFVNFIVDNSEVFLTCFATTFDQYIFKNGLLSQFLRYGNYAIKFKDPLLRPKEVFNINSNEGSFWTRTFVYYFKNDGFGKVLSHDIIFKDVFAKELCNIEKHVREFFTKLPPKIPTSDQFSEVLNNFLRCCYSSKHYGFSEENEIRFIVIVFNKMEFYYSDQGRKYIKIFENDEITRDIEEIIIGPVFDKKKEAIEIKKMLKSYNVNAKVRISTTPLKK